MWMPVVSRKNFKNIFPFFWKNEYHKLYIFQFQIFYTYWPSLLYKMHKIIVYKCPETVPACFHVTMPDHPRFHCILGKFTTVYIRVVYSTVHGTRYMYSLYCTYNRVIYCLIYTGITCIGQCALFYNPVEQGRGHFAHS